MKIKDIVRFGRKLYAICPNQHQSIWPGGKRFVALDLSELYPEMDHPELRGRVRCSVAARRMHDASW
jgi:hypothetical protein